MQVYFWLKRNSSDMSILFTFIYDDHHVRFQLLINIYEIADTFTNIC